MGWLNPVEFAKLWDARSRRNLGDMAERAQATGIQRNVDLGLAAVRRGGTEDPRMMQQLKSRVDDTNAAKGIGLRMEDVRLGLQGQPVPGADYLPYQELPGAPSSRASEANKQKAYAAIDAARETNRQAYAAHLGQDLLRGANRRLLNHVPGVEVMGDKGAAELVLRFLAQRDGAGMMTRRGLTGAAALGGGVGVTTGAQQLLALIEFMNQGKQTEERAQNSPLA